MSAPAPEPDRLLVQAALEAVERENHVRAGELLGVSESQIRLWRAGVVRPLKPSIRLTLERALDPIRLSAAHARGMILRLAGQRREMTKTELRLLHLLQQIVQLDPAEQVVQRRRKRGQG